MDALGHINNVPYFEFFQDGRAYYMPAVSKKWDWNKYMFVIAHIECNYYKEMLLTAKNPILKIRTLSLGNKSFDLEYMVVSEGKNGEEILHAKGKSTQVMFDMINKKSISLPDWLRDDIMAFEPGLSSK